MASSRQLAVLAALALALLACAGVASAARPAPASGGGEVSATTPASYLQMYPAAAVVEKARETVEMLMARLPAGPSPEGPGH